MRLGVVEASDEATDTEGPHSSLLSVLLLGFSHELGDELNRRTVVVVESVALAFDAGLVGEDTAVSGEAGVGHVDVVVELDDLFDGSAFLQLGDCFFLDGGCSTSTARITVESVTRPTAQRPFFTASIAY
jgi:hypothetical protein